MLAKLHFNPLRRETFLPLPLQMDDIADNNSVYISYDIYYTANK